MIYLLKVSNEPFFYDVFAGEQTQVSAMKTRAEQFVDRILKILKAVEDSNCLTDCFASRSVDNKNLR